MDNKQLEKEFIDEIDCNFPYHDKENCLSLIDMAIGISSDAVYYVVYELCYLPNSVTIAKPYLLELLNVIDGKFVHQAKEIILDAARQIIKDGEVPFDIIITKMNEIRKMPKEYAALYVLNGQSYDNEQEWEAVDAVHSAITDEWSKV